MKNMKGLPAYTIKANHGKGQSWLQHKNIPALSKNSYMQTMISFSNLKNCSEPETEIVILC